MRSAGLVVKAAGALALAVGVAGGGAMLIRWYAGPYGWDRAAQIGNVIGGVGSAFSAVAVLAAIATVYLQAIALEEQRRELRAAQEDQAKQAATMQRSIELQALAALVTAWVEWPSLAKESKGPAAGDAPYTRALSELEVLIRQIRERLQDQPVKPATSTPTESVK